MDLKTAIRAALDGEAILFAGAGFSYGAKNIYGSKFCFGDSLRDLIATDCGKTTSLSLSATAQYYTKIKSVDSLIQLLKDQFTVSEIAPWHESILSINWKRIYTTNYDAVIEKAATKNRKTITPIVLSDDIYSCGINNICVHLNGYIGRLNRATINKEFKLIDSSYACEAISNYSWFNLFKDDLASSKAIIIIGYSMQYDIDIKRLLSAPSIKSKVLFIDKPDSEDIAQSLLEDYGVCEFIGIGSFANQLARERDQYTALPKPRNYKSFVHEYRASSVTSTVDLHDLISFYTRGKFTSSLLLDNHGKYKYIITRNQILRVLKEYRSKKVFLILSDLGNGKTIFCNILRDYLKREEANVYIYTNNFVDIDNEISNICCDKTKHSVVIFDDYKSKIEILKKFRFYDKSKMTFVLTSRTAINPKYNQLTEALGVNKEDIVPIFLDGLTSDEIDDLSYVVQSNSLYNSSMKGKDLNSIASYITDECKSTFAGFLLQAYKSSDIKSRLAEYWQESKLEPIEYKRIAILVLMKAVMGIDFDFSHLLDLLQLDFVLISAAESPFLNELFDLNTDTINIKSSVVAKEVLSNIVGIKDLIEVMILVVKAADKEYKFDTSYTALLKNVLSHSHFKMLNVSSEDSKYIINFYESIRECEFCQDNVFYWEQFATSCIDIKDFDTADQCIRNAEFLARSKEKNGFVPFQLENIIANYILENLIFKSSSGVSFSTADVLEEMSKCQLHLLKHYNYIDNNSMYTFRVAHKYIYIYRNWGSLFNKVERSKFTQYVNEILKLMRDEKKNPTIINGALEKWISDLESCTFD